MSKLKMHSKRELSYDPQTTGPVWTECHRIVDASQVAAFSPEGVTCKKCLASINWRAEAEASLKKGMDSLKTGQAWAAGVKGRC